MLDIDPVTFDRAYNGVANALLWFIAHLLFATPTAPVFDPRTRREWEAYGTYSRRSPRRSPAQAAPGATVLVQDYHLSLCRGSSASGARTCGSGTSATPRGRRRSTSACCPTPIATAVLRGLLGADAVGFHSPRWADAFGRCCVELLGASYDGRAVDPRRAAHARRPCTRWASTPTSCAPGAAEPDVQAGCRGCASWSATGSCCCASTAPSCRKNIVRGLRGLPRAAAGPAASAASASCTWPSPTRRGTTCPSTGRTPARAARRARGQRGVRHPGLAAGAPRGPRRLPAVAGGVPLADVLLVNPLRDGMNLVAKEGPVLSEQGLSLVLSRAGRRRRRARRRRPPGQPARRVGRRRRRCTRALRRRRCCAAQRAAAAGRRRDRPAAGRLAAGPARRPA